MITETDLNKELYGILNTERNRMLTSANGIGVWKDKQKAKETLSTEFGDGSHLKVVKITQTEK